MRTKLLLVSSFILLLTGFLNAQDLRQRMDLLPGAICRDMVRLPGGTTLVVGEMSGAPIPYGWVSQLSETGEVLWTKIPFDQNLASQFLRVLPDTDSTFLIGGTQYVDLINGTDLLLIRMTNKGKVMWSRTVNFNQADVFSDMDLFAKGAVLVGTTLDDATQLDVVVAILDEKGNPGITRQFGAAGLESATGIRFAGPHGFYISGTTTSYTFPGQPPSAFLLQISPSVSLSWMRLIGDADQQSLQSMALNNSGLPLIGVHDNGGLGVNYICQFSHNGVLEWAKSYNSNYMRAMTRTPGGKVYVADDQKVFGLDNDGNVVSTWLLQPDNDFITSCLQIGQQGQYLLGGWNYGNQDYPAMHVIKDPLNSTCDVGTTITVGQDYKPMILNELINQFDGGKVDILELILIDIKVNRIIDCQTTSVDLESTMPLSMVVSPNPANSSVVLDLPSGKTGILSWYRQDGSLLSRQQTRTETGSLTTNISGWLPGTYIAEFQSGNQRWTTRVIRSE